MNFPGIKVPVVEISPFHAPDFARIGVDEASKTGYYRACTRRHRDAWTSSPFSPARHFVMLDQPEKFNVALDACAEIHARIPRRNDHGLFRHAAVEKAGIQGRAAHLHARRSLELPEDAGTAARRHRVQARVAKTTGCGGGGGGGGGGGFDETWSGLKLVLRKELRPKPAS